MAALQKHWHLRGEWVLALVDGSPVPRHVLRDWLEAAQRRAGLRVVGSLHKLRHAFCSHLAMRARESDPGAGRAREPLDDAPLHVPEPTRDQAIALLKTRANTRPLGQSDGNRGRRRFQAAGAATEMLWS
jgi:hypothetical protein